MHFVKSTRVEQNQINFNGISFYTSHVITYRQIPTERFTKNCTIPVIIKSDKRVADFKYLVLANTVFKIFDEQKINVALFDKNCNIIHLLPRLVAKSRSVYVYTECVNRYEKENNRIFSLLGAAAVINDIPVSPKGTHAIISFEPYLSDNILVFGKHGYFIDNGMPIWSGFGPLILPNYTDVYSALAGLYSIGKIKNIGNAYCEKLCRNGYTYDIKNLP